MSNRERMDWFDGYTRTLTYSSLFHKLQLEPERVANCLQVSELHILVLFDVSD